MKFLHRLASTISNGQETAIEAHTRREWLKRVGLVSASGIVLAACGQEDAKERRPLGASMASGDSEKEGSSDANISEDTTKQDQVADGALLNAALTLEHEAIAIYTAAAGLDIWKGSEAVLDIAKSFAGHHVEHRDDLIAAINGMREENSDVAAPVETLTTEEYLKGIDASALTVLDVLRIASVKEMGAAKAYLGLISSFKSGELAQTSGMLGGDEAGHYGALRAALFAVAGDSDVTPQNLIAGAYPKDFVQKTY